MSEITFSDILITPSYSEVNSRSEVDLRTKIFTTPSGKDIKIFPIISANMKHVTGPKMCATMAELNSLGILHRFDEDYFVSDYRKTVSLVKEHVFGCRAEVNKRFCLEPDFKEEDIPYRIGVSIGVKEGTDHNRAHKLYEAGARLFCIDVAHGHHVKVKNMISCLRMTFGKEVIIIAGNVATPEGAKDLFSWGADIVKVGIGPSKVCQTRRNTGVGVPQFSAIRDIRMAVGEDKIIISDGGIQYSSDIAKALIFANAVMTGSLLAGSSETPGHVYRDENNQLYKVYGGSASGENKVSNGGENRFVEGVIKHVRFQGHVKHILNEINDHLQSSFSYVGSMNHDEFRAKAQYKIISGGGKEESKL